MNKFPCFAVLSLSLLLFSGCSRNDGRPEDLPPLFPVTITVTQEGVALEGAHVELTPQGSPGHPYRAAATSDANGNATMKTYGFPGAPTGNCKIIVRKGVVENIVYGTDAVGREIVLSSDSYIVVQGRYSNAEETPHEIEVPANRKGVQVTIDVGEAVRNRVTR
jgi:hypothetical protein